VFRKFVEPKGRVIFKMDCGVSDSMFVIPIFVIPMFVITMFAIPMFVI